LERTLDDSANRRIVIPQAFLATDAILMLLINIAGGLTVYPKVIKKQLDDELPFMATENILMHCVKKGGDRQLLHERLRIHSLEAAKRIKEEGKENDLLSRILEDKAFGITDSELQTLLKPEQFIGMAEKQTEVFLSEVKAILQENEEFLGAADEISV
ncbi:MAG: adenylosuccinate lyase, partial [Treponema sp.]|nr:adenylosuccinate lyase [Treponema sp.]